VKKQSHEEKVRRKNYEIKTLKDELRAKQLESVHRRHSSHGTRVRATDYLLFSVFCRVFDYFVDMFLGAATVDYSSGNPGLIPNKPSAV